MMITYAIELVGGQWDGQRGFAWIEGAGPAGERTGQPPRVIYVGECAGDGACLGSVMRCRGLAYRVGHEPGPHPAYWLPDEELMAPEAERYVRRGDPEPPEGEEPGRVVYSKGGMVLPAERDALEAIPLEETRVVDGPPLVTARTMLDVWNGDVPEGARWQLYGVELWRWPPREARHDQGWPK